ncbi:hypothetical protein [Mesorhizobium sp. ES1-3]|uniref:hypothetical protein n=1 Tax=Mesorhizobium sp. ES1-3 TaxID=2876628 RepID=UPI001CCEDAF3|nr:hypothetical protein [Mesorhizobium sp. ES1-3]
MLMSMSSPFSMFPASDAPATRSLLPGNDRSGCGVSTQSYFFLKSEDQSGALSRQAICEAVHITLARVDEKVSGGVAGGRFANPKRAGQERGLVFCGS